MLWAKICSEWNIYGGFDALRAPRKWRVIGKVGELFISTSQCWFNGFRLDTSDPSRNFRYTPLNPMQCWQKHNLMWRKTSHTELNWAPYHIICQCFNVYILLEGGHNVKNTNTIKWQKYNMCSIPRRRAVACVPLLWILSLTPPSIKKINLNAAIKCSGRRGTYIYIYIQYIYIYVYVSFILYFETEGMRVSWILWMWMIPNNKFKYVFKRRHFKTFSNHRRAH